VGKYSVDVNTFEATVVTALKGVFEDLRDQPVEERKKTLVVLDEIGKTELLSLPFRAVAKILLFLEPTKIPGGARIVFETWSIYFYVIFPTHAKIGKMELLSQPFRVVVKKLLALANERQDLLFVCVIPSATDDAFVRELHTAPDRSSTTQKYELTKMNREKMIVSVRDVVQAWVDAPLNVCFPPPPSSGGMSAKEQLEAAQEAIAPWRSNPEGFQHPEHSTMVNDLDMRHKAQDARQKLGAFDIRASKQKKAAITQQMRGGLGPLQLCNSEALHFVSTLRAPRPASSKQRVSCLEPGMVLIKNWLPPQTQQDIINAVGEMGVGTAGFFKPTYEGGEEMKLMMMCMGKHWNCRKKTYEPLRTDLDRAIVPPIPLAFVHLMREALWQAFVADPFCLGGDEVYSDLSGPLDPVFTQLLPNVCLCNFYADGGQLGLHQDKDESADSLQKAYPVVSLSCGEAAQFVYSHKLAPFFFLVLLVVLSVFYPLVFLSVPFCTAVRVLLCACLVF
jgi:alkylated DNA repair dioxygenase AlkB/nucleoside-triphosphatase THEP1